MKTGYHQTGLPGPQPGNRPESKFNQRGKLLQKVFLLTLIMVFLGVGMTPALRSVSAEKNGASKPRQNQQEAPPGMVLRYKPGMEPIPGQVEWDPAPATEPEPTRRPDGSFTTLVGTDDCPGTRICSLPFNDSDTTVGANNTINTLPSGCNTYTQVAGPDKIYTLTVGATNSITVSVDPTGANWDVSVYLVRTCPAGTGNTITSGNCVTGDDNGGSNTTEGFTVTNIAAGTYFLVVDSFYPATGTSPLRQGTYDLSVTGSGLVSGDLSITKTDGITTTTAGSTLTYTIVASNAGGSCTATGATIADTFSAQFTSVSWTSVAAGGATGNDASGTGNINDTGVNLPAGASVTYTVTATLSGSATGSVSNTATITAPGGFSDSNSGNNSATDTDTIMAAGCMVTCPSNVITNNSAGQCGAVVTFGNPTTSGSCGIVSVVPPSGSFFTVGSTTVMVTTMAGPSCSFTVTVNDTEPPMVTCPANIVTGATSTAGAVVSFMPTVWDNCSGVSFVSTPPSGSTFPIGTTTVMVTATDASNNTASCSFTVTVQGVELDRVYVADTANNRCQVFDGAVWQLVPGTAGTVGSSSNQFRSPEAITANADGSRIYVADTGNNRIQFTTDSGATWQTFATLGSASNQVRAPQGLALDLNGNLYVADTGNNRLMRFDGGLPGPAVIFATAGSTLGKVSTPRGLAVDASRTLYVADFGNNRIQKFTTADVTPTPGLVATTGSSQNPGQVRSPEGVGVDDEGNLYVADTGNNRVIEFPGGAAGPAVLLLNIGSTFGKARLPEGVTVCQGVVLGGMATESALIVGDTANNRIQGSLTPADPLSYELVGNPLGGVGSLIGNFRSPSKIR
ncbi:MAG TPA: HYR domain-containing protein [Acidobacteriota bacterium]|nr:HYR domain-containing protein [Acidobacteriota bacterium]